LSFGKPGTPTWRLEPVVSKKLPFKAETTCVNCGDRMTVELGTVYATFRIGLEFVGVTCDGCIDERSRAIAEDLRRAAPGQGRKP